MFSQYCNVIFTEEELTTPFAIHPSRGKGAERWYGERVNVKNFDEENVILLDSDTIMLNNPKRLFEGDFDFRSCPKDLISRQWQHTSNLRIRAKRVFKLDYERTHVWGGPQIFKNYAHKKICDEWLRTIEKDRHHMDYCMSPNRKTYDQLSLTPVIARSNLKIATLEPGEDVFFRCSYADVDSLKDKVVIAHGNDLIEDLNLRSEINKLREEL